ncbi:Uncharacterised protein [Mycobacterium tuberculosis]|nr:Uncharacterised protein [Mycobacterium tuberculosis]COZ43942.1 Uncharacterised protein [Mycobacterium tuberculosis]
MNTSYANCADLSPVSITSRRRRKSRSPANPNIPDRWLSIDSMSSTPILAVRHK